MPMVRTSPLLHSLVSADVHTIQHSRLGSRALEAYLERREAGCDSVRRPLRSHHPQIRTPSRRSAAGQRAGCCRRDTAAAAVVVV